MKTVVLKSVILLFILSSCAGSKSFMHQRYTSYGHKKHHTEAEKPQSYAGTKTARSAAEAPVATEVVMPSAAVTAPAKQAAEQPRTLTASADKHALRTIAAAPKLLKAALLNTEPYSLQKSNHSKTFDKQLKKESKHGLLFGIIDAILAIILAVIFVGLIVLLVLVLI